MSGTVAPEREVPTRLPRVGYIPALDGLRALAVIAVLLYHGDVKWMPGGFLGVDVFFVISGYLITSLLLGDWREHRHIRFGRFYLRRARRLLPALFLMLAVVALYALLFLPDTVSELRGQAIAAIFYVENWYLIFHKVSYFVAVGRPPMLRHVWSLAVEEQFYLLWPLIFAFLLARWGRHREKLLAAVVGGALASTVLMAVLYQPFTDPSRVYFGTDTRASTMLIGAALAIVWAPWRLTRKAAKGAPLRARRDVDRRLSSASSGSSSTPASSTTGCTAAVSSCVALFGALLHRGDRASRVAAVAEGLRPPCGVGRRALVRHLPVALAGLHGHAAARRRRRSPASRCWCCGSRSPSCWPRSRISYVEEPIRHGASGAGVQQFRRAKGERRRQLGTGFADRRQRDRGRDPGDRRRASPGAGADTRVPRDCPPVAVDRAQADHHDDASGRPLVGRAPVRPSRPRPVASRPIRRPRRRRRRRRPTSPRWATR